MSRTVSQSLALQAANIIMEKLAEQEAERLLQLDPRSPESKAIYRKIIFNGAHTYKSAASIFGLNPISIQSGDKQ